MKNQEIGVFPEVSLSSGQTLAFGNDNGSRDNKNALLTLDKHGVGEIYRREKPSDEQLVSVAGQQVSL